MKLKSKLESSILLWRWWSTRNRVNAGERMMNGDEVRSSVNYYLLELGGKIACPAQSTISTPGFVVRDSDGSALEAGAGIV
uniref:Uncharacterized protein n=1 Tax=Oryza punctata TaxID=4537 RepID=A0A0E0KIY0_ORYPU